MSNNNRRENRSQRLRQTARQNNSEFQTPEYTPAQNLLTGDARLCLRRAIQANGGAEVFFAGWINQERLIDRIQVLSRGNQTSAPVNMLEALDADVAIHNHPSGNLMASNADIEVAGQLSYNATGFWITNNDVTEVQVVVPVIDSVVESDIGAAEIDAIIGPDGEISKHLHNYQVRTGQIQMAHGVIDALTKKRLLLCEAGTGTGKTFAYLVPAILWAVKNNKRVVVSTGTINLQEQIAIKDIPFLQQGFMPQFRAVLVKGRGNYVSLRRAQEAAQLNDDAFEDENDQHVTRELIEWSKKTATGDRNEITPKPAARAWERVESQSDNCMGGRCPRFKDCHYYKVRKKAKNAEILIVNHHLLFADLAAKHEMGSLGAAAVLPPYDRIIVDEAHKLEEVAASYFGHHLSEYGLQMRFGRLWNKRGRKKKPKGLFPSLLRKIQELNPTRPDDQRRLGAAAQTLEENLPSLVKSCKQALTYAFDIGRGAVEMLQLENAGAQSTGNKNKDQAQKNQSSRSELPKLRIRPKPQGEIEMLFQDNIVDPLEELKTRIGLLVKVGQSILENLDNIHEELQLKLQGPLLEYSANLTRLAGSAQSIQEFSQFRDPSHVRWFELTRRKLVTHGHFYACPLHLGPLLREALWEKIGSAVLTSATLKTDSGFAFMRHELGLNASVARRVNELTVDSPFDYREQSILALPDDCSEVRERGFIHDLCYAIDRMVEISEGRAFLLFTSYSMLKQVHGRISRHLARKGLVCLLQGELTRRDLLSRFKTTKGAVLFGTDSFWEGVDVPGQQLSLVVVAKMPFRVPSEPLQQARAEQCEARGGQPFLELTLPQAVLKLRQGFGRLIRTREDRGVVVIMDKRLLTKYYGARVLRALPEARRIIGPLEETVLPQIKNFLES